MADSITDLLEAMLSGALAPARETECPACMGSLRIGFIQSGEDPRRVSGEGRCGHCHDADAVEDRPLIEAIRRHLLKTEGVWRVRIKESSPGSAEAARSLIKETGLDLEGTQVEMQFVADRLRAAGHSLGLSRTEAT